MENSNQGTPQGGGTKNNNKTVVIVAVIVVVVVILAIAGNAMRGFLGRKVAEKVGEGILERGTGANVDLRDGAVRVSGKDGQLEVGSMAQWPDDMPADVIKFDAGEIAGAVRINNENANGWSVILKNVEQDAVVNYVKKLEDGGWKNSAQVNFGAAIYQYEKNDLRLNLAYDLSSKGVNLTVNIEKIETK